MHQRPVQSVQLLLIVYGRSAGENKIDCECREREITDINRNKKRQASKSFKKTRK